jgi:hypothetical protein
MLKSIDVLIGISVVMLIVSMVVTVLTQFITSTFNVHGISLRRGLRDLILHLGPAVTNDMADEIADAVLRHPLVGGPPKILSLIGFGEKCRLGTVIHRDELTRTLMELASPNSSWVRLKKVTKAQLANALGFANPEEVDQTLDKIRATALVLEESHPELARNVRADMAILQEAKTTLVGKINGWFDQSIDRVSERFTMGARSITFGCALVVAMVIQLDAIYLVNTLWTNDSIRQALVVQAENVEHENPNVGPDQIKIDNDELKRLRGLAMNELIVIPWSTSNPIQQPSPGNSQLQNGSGFLVKLPGIVLSAFLLSLGAPFWYNTLKTFVRMRPEIADKDDAQRIARQSDGLVGPPPPKDASA